MHYKKYEIVTQAGCISTHVVTWPKKQHLKLQKVPHWVEPAETLTEPPVKFIEICIEMIQNLESHSNHSGKYTGMFMSVHDIGICYGIKQHTKSYMKP